MAKATGETVKDDNKLLEVMDKTMEKNLANLLRATKKVTSFINFFEKKFVVTVTENHDYDDWRFVVFNYIILSKYRSRNHSTFSENFTILEIHSLESIWY